MARRGDGIYQRGSTWRLEFIHNGERHVVTLGRKISRTAAAEIAQVKRAAILKGELGIGRKRRDIDFEKAAEEFLAAAKANTRPNTFRSYSQHLGAMKPLFGGKRLSEISAFLIEKYKQQRIADGVRPSFNRELGTLKTLFNWALDKGKFEGANPARKVKRLEESKGRERTLTAEEETRLFAECTQSLKTLLMCGIYAGLRIPSEVLNLTWGDIDLARGRLTVLGAYAKNGKTEIVPLTSRLHEALEALKRSKPTVSREPEALVFTRQDGKPYKSLQNIFRTAAKRAGIAGISPHVCRHTFATRLAEGGIDLRTIQELGRWASLAMVQRYSNISESHKTEAIELLSKNSTPKSTPAANVAQIPTGSKRLQIVVGE
jgi:integrase